MAVSHVAPQFQTAGFAFLLAVFPIEVHTCRLRCRQAVAAAVATASAAEAAVGHVVGRAVSRDAAGLCEVRNENAVGIAVFRADTEVDVTNPRAFELAFRCDVEHSGFLTIVDASLLRIVALLVVGLDFAHEVGGKILHGDLGVALEKVFSVDQKFLHLLAVPRDGAVVVDFNAWQLFNQSFER